MAAKIQVPNLMSIHKLDSVSFFGGKKKVTQSYSRALSPEYCELLGKSNI